MGPLYKDRHVIYIDTNIVHVQMYISFAERQSCTCRLKIIMIIVVSMSPKGQRVNNCSYM